MERMCFITLLGRVYLISTQTVPGLLTGYVLSVWRILFQPERGIISSITKKDVLNYLNSSNR